ncbi:MAG: hypothetical protein KC550_01340 [Nanoarchaeota archaeon]|nr:hypothetical protein [Nanoarchaeota archaeon]
MGVELIESLVSEKILRQYCGEPKAPLHPNRISAIGGASTLCGTLMLSHPWTAPIGVFGIVAGDAVADYYDGKFATKYDLKTKEGAKLDPFFDKVKNFSVGTYVIAVEGMTNPLSLVFASSFVVDAVSQRMGRGPFLEQTVEVYNAVRNPENCISDNNEKSKLRAVSFGKWKTGLQAATHISYAVNQLVPYDYIFSNNTSNLVEQGVNYGLAGLLGVSTILGVMGIVKRVGNSN